MSIFQKPISADLISPVKVIIPDVPCPFNSSHRIHYGSTSESCSNYLSAPRILKGHQAACKWEGYISPTACGCRR